MEIREATVEDAKALQLLIGQLGYTQSVDLIKQKINIFASNPHQYIFIAQINLDIVGFLSLSIIPQVAVEGDFARVAYLCVDEKLRSKGIGQALLAYSEELAKQLGCDRMELHSSDYRKQAHQFYFAQGYKDEPKYFRKILN